MKKIKFGIIGGGLMGREAASAFARWFVLKDFPVMAELVAVCDLDKSMLEWYRQTGSVNQLTTDYREILNNKDVDVVYVALPHHLHQAVYTDVLAAGKDLLAEKPFGIDLASARKIKAAADKSGRFVRCSSEFPFLPGPQRLIHEVIAGGFGKIIEIKAGFFHSSDMDPLKPVNWKRQSAFCGEIGVMGDLGMHVLHIPLRMGWKPETVFAQLQKIITRRPDGKGGWADCDTWNNATLLTSVHIKEENIPLTLEMKRLSPGQTNTWFIEVLGMEGGAKYSTKDTKAYWSYKRDGRLAWQREDLGFSGLAFPVITGGIFETGFPDCFMQMLAAFVAEREGFLGQRFGCVTPDEAVKSHFIFEAALQSAAQSSADKIDWSGC